jgi:hypothetical protein
MKIFIFVLLILASYTTLAEEDCSADAGFNNKQELLKFTESLKLANTVETLSPLISYPLRVNKTSKKHYIIKNEASLKVHFNEIFTAKILAAIHDNGPEATFCNYQGLTFGHGAVWINKRNGKPGIFVVNTPEK